MKKCIKIRTYWNNNSPEGSTLGAVCRCLYDKGAARELELRRFGNTMLSTKQIVQGEFTLDAIRMLIPCNALGCYHGNNDILVCVCCLNEC